MEKGLHTQAASCTRRQLLGSRGACLTADRAQVGVKSAPCTSGSALSCAFQLLALLPGWSQLEKRWRLTLLVPCVCVCVCVRVCLCTGWRSGRSRLSGETVCLGFAATSRARYGINTRPHRTCHPGFWAGDSSVNIGHSHTTFICLSTLCVTYLIFVVNSLFSPLLNKCVVNGIIKSIS